MSRADDIVPAPLGHLDHRVTPARVDPASLGNHPERAPAAHRIEEYAALGISEFILSGYPHLEEACWFGEGVPPILRQRGRWQHPAPGSAEDSVSTTPFAPTPGPAHPAAVS